MCIFQFEKVTIKVGKFFSIKLKFKWPSKNVSIFFSYSPTGQVRQGLSKVVNHGSPECSAKLSIECFLSFGKFFRNATSESQYPEKTLFRIEFFGILKEEVTVAEIHFILSDSF